MIKLVHAMAMQQARAPDPVWLDAARVAVGACAFTEAAGRRHQEDEPRPPHG